jgi:hypothetical protein
VNENYRELQVRQDQRLARYFGSVARSPLNLRISDSDLTAILRSHLRWYPFSSNSAAAVRRMALRLAAYRLLLFRRGSLHCLLPHADP